MPPLPLTLLPPFHPVLKNNCPTYFNIIFLPALSGEEYEPSPLKWTPRSHHLALTSFARECVRTNTTSRNAAFLANALLNDLNDANLLSRQCDLSSMRVDKSRMDREKQRVQEEERARQESEGLICIGVDGKDDKQTLCYEVSVNESGASEQKQVRETEHHVTFTQESGPKRGEYLTHRVAGENKTGPILGKLTAGVIFEHKSENSIKAILCDNTGSNTGWKTGLVVTLEKEIGKRVHLIGCSLHQNELPWKHVFGKLDGGTKGPNTLSGPVGKLLTRDFHDEPQAEFVPISSRIDELGISDNVVKG